jgi:hypothetical protein
LTPPASTHEIGTVDDGFADLGGRALSVAVQMRRSLVTPSIVSNVRSVNAQLSGRCAGAAGSMLVSRRVLDRDHAGGRVDDRQDQWLVACQVELLQTLDDCDER